MTPEEFRQRRAERLEACADIRSSRISSPPLRLERSRDTRATRAVIWFEHPETDSSST